MIAKFSMKVLLLTIALVLSMTLPSTVATDLSFRGVYGYLRSLEEQVVSEETLWFYRFFGENLPPSKLNLAKNCDYADPSTHEFCPPPVNPLL